jgi:3-oxocholest-4-en-26-oate---CoA ligase
MARPIADELAAHPGECDLSSLVYLASGAALLSRSVRDQIQAICPDLLIAESFGFFLGRGSMCINAGGEKVYPEEVEQTLKAHPAVIDALVVGVPDERFGERVAAVVALRPGAAAETDALREHCRETLAGYKVPAKITFVAQVTRSPSGKADYRWARAVLAGPEPAPPGPR